MSSRKDEAERVQFLISLGQQPGLGAWFTVWRVATRRREKPASKAAVKAMHRGSCAA